MSKFNLVLFILLSFATTFILADPVHADHPICPSSNVDSKYFVNPPVDNPEKCPTGTCVHDGGSLALESERYGCYKIQTTSSTPPLSQQPPPTTGTNLQPGVSCSAEPTIVNRGGYFTFKASGLKPNQNYRIQINGFWLQFKDTSGTNRVQIASSATGEIETPIYPESAVPAAIDEGTVILYEQPKVGLGSPMCTVKIKMAVATQDIPKDQNWYRCDKGKSKACTVYKEPKPGATLDKAACDKACMENFCKEPSDPNFNKDKDRACVQAAGLLCDNNKGIYTAIGCIHTDPALLTQDVLKLASGIGGGIAFLLMLLGAFRMITSQGNPQELKEGQEIFTSAIIGLLFVIFSVLFMQIIGLNILGLPGFK